jgi:hypothetical protein
MCRYAFKRPYKRHFACFQCRKAFKRAPLAEPSDAVVDPAPCPDCGARMADLRLDFARPPKNEVEHWEVAEHLFRKGFGHHNCGCGGSGPLPSRWSEVPAFLQARRQESPGEQLLTRRPPR